MVLKPIQTLYEHSLQVVSDNIFKFVREHCESCKFCSVCKTEQCSTIKPVMESLNLPDKIIQSVYNKVYSEHRSLLYPNSGLLYLFLSLLRVERTSVQIKDMSFIKSDWDMLFILKFGKNMNSLNFSHENVLQPNTDMEISALLCTDILQSVINVQVLDFNGVKITGELLEVIGRECTQLKVLNSIILDYDSTPESFMKLLFHTNETGTHRNKCCDTLQAVNLDFVEMYDYIQHEYMNVNEILAVLLDNITNLKSVGKEVVFEIYLQTVQRREIPCQVSLAEVNFFVLETYTVEMLQPFCPTLKKLRTENLGDGAAQDLTSFECLDEVIVMDTSDIIVQEIFNAQWVNLRVLKVLSSSSDECFHLDIDLVAKNLPVLTDLSATISKISWSKKTHFSCLEKVRLQILSCKPNNICWFASFANTVKIIDLSCDDVMILDDCDVLLTVPFPNLEYLCIDELPYNFPFYSSIITKLPKLEVCFLYCYQRESQEKRNQNNAELSKFLRENNLQCDVNGSSSYCIYFD